MRCSVLSSLGLLLLFGSAVLTAQPPDQEGGAEDAREDQRWLPEACRLALTVAHASTLDPKQSDEALWNHFYRLGFKAIQEEDLESAETGFCRALEAARSFGPRDIRFAETLDELGLVRYLGGDDQGAEAMQGAAVAEMLLALGPPSEDLRETARKSCRSSVAIYMVRLGWIFQRQGRGEEIKPLLQAPYRILGRGYVPYDSVLGRLDGLIAQYLLIEDFGAADWLSSLRNEVANR